MSVSDGVIAFLTILLSLLAVVLVVGAAWWLMWKVNNYIYLNMYLIVDLAWPIFADLITCVIL